MKFFHWLLTLILVLSAAGILAFVVAAKEARYWGTACEVSQVFKHLSTQTLAGKNRFNIYDVAVTPLAPNEIAKICHLYTVTSEPGLNLLDKKVWYMPVPSGPFAYYETPEGFRLLYGLSGIAAVLMVLAVLAVPKSGD